VDVRERRCEGESTIESGWRLSVGSAQAGCVALVRLGGFDPRNLFRAHSGFAAICACGVQYKASTKLST
jgi:hypothetical protein